MTMPSSPHPEQPPTDLTLTWLTELHAICRLAADAPLPPWLADRMQRHCDGGLISVTRTEDELSIVVPQSVLPTDQAAEQDWAVMRIVGRLEFDLVGILAHLTEALAKQQIPVFAISTFDTDYLLVRAVLRDSAQQALDAVGMRFER